MALHQHLFDRLDDLPSTFSCQIIDTTMCEFMAYISNGEDEPLQLLGRRDECRKERESCLERQMLQLRRNQSTERFSYFGSDRLLDRSVAANGELEGVLLLEDLVYVELRL